MDGNWATGNIFPIHQFCNGLLYINQKCTNCVQCFAYLFMCNNGTSCNLNMPCQDGSARTHFFAALAGADYPSEWMNNGSFRIGAEFFGHELFGIRSSCAPYLFYSVFKHEFGSPCFDATDQCAAMAVKCNITCCRNKNAGMYCYGHCVPTCDYPLSVSNGQGINYTAIWNNCARYFYCNNNICTPGVCGKDKLPTASFLTTVQDCTLHNCYGNPACFFYLPTNSAAPFSALGAVKTLDPNTLGTVDKIEALPYITDKVPSDYACFTAKGCDHKYGPLPSYGVAPNANTCDMQLFCYARTNLTADGDAAKLHVAISCICKQCCSVACTTAICKCAVYFRLYCG
jgi:hypothetical protein